MKRLSGDILRGHLDGMVLATLGRGAAHGFEIMRRLNEEGRDAFLMKEGTLYPVLYRLEREGMLEGVWEPEDAPRKGPRRRIYRLTPRGKRELGACRENWRNFVDVVGAIMEA